MDLTASENFGDPLGFADRSAAAIRVIRRALVNLEALGDRARPTQSADVRSAIDALETEDFGEACVCAECSHVPRENDERQGPGGSLSELTARLGRLATIMSVMTYRAYRKA